MTYFGELLLLIANILMAWHHAELIEEGRPIRHGWWGAAYLALAICFAWLNQSWALFVASLFLRKIVFDLSLNIFRDLPIFYVSSSTTSIIDKLHYRFFGKRSEVYMSFYLLLLIFINIFFL